MLNIIRVRLLSQWEENIVVRDMISILLFIFICSFNSIFVNIILFGVNSFLMLVDTLSNIFDFGATINELQINTSLTTIADNLLEDMEIIIYLISILLVSLGITLLLKKEKLRIPLTLAAIIIFNCIRDSNTLFLVFVILIVLIPLSWMVTIGSGKYYSVVEFLAYFQNMYPINFKLKDLTLKRTTIFALKVFIRILIPMILFVYLMSRVVEGLDVLLAIEIYFGIVLFVFLNYSEKLVYLSLRRIGVYLLIVFLTIFNINNEKLEIVPIILSVFTILFSLNRVLSAIDDIRKDVENNSCLYAFDHRGNDHDWLVKNYVDYKVLKNAQVSENFLLRQIIIHHLLYSENCLDMISRYESLYENNLNFVKQLEFMENYNNEKMSLKEKIRKYKNYFPEKEESHSSIFAYTNYCYLLVLDGQYDLCIKLLSEWYIAIRNDDKYILYYAYVHAGKEKEAQVLKQDIDRFDEIEIEFINEINEQMKTT